jgi:hypothetical protein
MATRVSPERLDDEVHGVPAGHRERRRGQQRGTEARDAVNLGRVHPGAQQGARAARRDRDVGEPQELAEPQRVVGGPRQVDVAADRGDSQDLQVGTPVSEDDRQRVVDSRVAVDDDLSGEHPFSLDQLAHNQQIKNDGRRPGRERTVTAPDEGVERSSGRAWVTAPAAKVRCARPA